MQILVFWFYILIYNDASNKNNIHGLGNVKTTIRYINNQYGSYYEKCYYLASGIMVGYMLDQSTIGLLSTFLTQVGQYIMAFRYDNSAKTMNTIECTISMLYYI